MSNLGKTEGSRGMSPNNDTRGLSRFSKMTVIIPIVISVLSLGFGVYQYVDKRTLEKEIMDLRGKEIRQKNKADVFIQYLESDLESILTYVDHGSSFDEACLKWLGYLQRTPNFGVRLEMVESPILREIEAYRGEVEDHYVTFLLINNTGGGKATDVSSSFSRIRNGERKDFAVKLDQLEPGDGVIFPIDHFDQRQEKYHGSRLRPRDYRLQYFDVFLNENKEITIREKLDSPKIVAPKIRLLR